jgi:hypothetical protein
MEATRAELEAAERAYRLVTEGDTAEGVAGYTAGNAAGGGGTGASTNGASTNGTVSSVRGES